MDTAIPPAPSQLGDRARSGGKGGGYGRNLDADGGGMMCAMVSKVKMKPCTARRSSLGKADLYDNSRRMSLFRHFVDAIDEDSTPLEAMEDGQTGGVYSVLKSPQSRASADPQEKLAIFKPECSEGFSRRGIPRGGGAIREEATYLIDRLTGSTAGVPVTTQAIVPEVRVRKSIAAVADNKDGKDVKAKLTGAVQRFVPKVAGAVEDYGMPRTLEDAAKMVTVNKAQHLANFDIRICNTDRHAGNLLLQETDAADAEKDGPTGRFVPVPIDHGCALPRWWSMGEANFEAWLDWPQVAEPCEADVISTIEEAYARRQEAVDMLAELGLEPAAQASYYIATAVLREGTVRHGLSLAAVARCLGRDPYSPGIPSWLEDQIAECAASAGVPWAWTENKYGDKVPAEPDDPVAWPAAGLMEKLEEVLASSAFYDAGVRAMEDCDGLDDDDD